MFSKKIVLGDSCLINYPQGAGIWILFIQYILGLKALGHTVFFFECFTSSADLGADEQKIRMFFERLREYDLQDQGVVLLFEKGKAGHDINFASSYGKRMNEVKNIIEGADLFWNLCCAFRQPFVGMFKHSVLVDMDPGHLQVSALDVEMGIHQHHSYLTVGGKMDDGDCEAPTLNLKWKPFKPFVYLPLWDVNPVDNSGRPFTTITHWNWDELDWNGRRLSLSKREAYMRYIDLPEHTKYPFEIAAYLEPDDPTGDRELLQTKGWSITDPWEATSSPKDYQNYISNSRAEISCPKPIFRELNTGWFSDRSVCYLAAGRPVLAEDTGFSDFLPTGKGLLAFRDLEGAVAGVNEINANYQYHVKAARNLAEEVFNSKVCLKAMIDLS